MDKVNGGGNVEDYHNFTFGDNLDSCIKKYCELYSNEKNSNSNSLYGRYLSICRDTLNASQDKTSEKYKELDKKLSDCGF